MIRQSHRYPRTAVEFALARDWKRDGSRDSLYAWRWPVGLLAALVLWLALVTLVGAATLPLARERMAGARHGPEAAAGLAHRFEQVIIQMS